jgi:hypothetical protein
MYYKKYFKYKNKLIGGSESGGGGEVPELSGEETKIIIDWDDTLFPTSFVSRARPYYSKDHAPWLAPHMLIDTLEWKSIPEYMKPAFKKYFKELEEQIKLIILNAQKYGEVIIVTNSEDGWIKDTCKLMPDLLPLLDTIKIISAQDKWKYKSPVPGDWKKFEFEEIARPFIESKKNKIIKLICIGDSIDEHTAILHVASIINAIDGYTAYTKQFKFKIKPDAIELYTQVNNMANYLCNNPDKIITNLTSNNYKFLD